MKRALTALLALLPLFSGVQAAGEGAPIEAWLNQRMALRTGPNTTYTEMFTLPQATPIQVYNREMGNGVDWAQVEFEYNGDMYRGYTGMKRIETGEEVPWMAFDGLKTRMGASATPRFGPGRAYAAHGDALRLGASVTAFYAEGGYAMIDYKNASGKLVRGWVPSSALEETPGGYAPGGADMEADEITVPYFPFEAGSARPNQKLSLRTGPSTSYAMIGGMPKSTGISVFYQTAGNDVLWGYVEYQSDGEWYRGYTGMKRIDEDGEVPLVREFSSAARTARDTRLRYGPGDDYARLPGAVPKGAAVQVYYASPDEEWLMVDYGGGAVRRGWMPAQDLAAECLFTEDAAEPPDGC